ncbi:putative holin-like toxin [Pullulanibacillus camelliae]
MSIYQALTLMISFGLLIIALLKDKAK